jgi:hypothetical protein
VAELVHIVLIAVAALLGLGAAGLAATQVFGSTAGALAHPPRVPVPAPPPWRATAASREPRQVTSGQPKAIEQHVHHHWHGTSPEDMAEILRRQQP